MFYEATNHEASGCKLIQIVRATIMAGRSKLMMQVLMVVLGGLCLVQNACLPQDDNRIQVATGKYKTTYVLRNNVKINGDGKLTYAKIDVKHPGLHGPLGNCLGFEYDELVYSIAKDCVYERLDIVSIDMKNDSGVVKRFNIGYTISMIGLVFDIIPMKKTV